MQRILKPDFMLKFISKSYYVDNDDEPSVKKKRKSTSRKSILNKSKSTGKSPKQKKIKEVTPKKRTGLIPNPDIKLLNEDPTFQKGSTIPLTIERQVIKATLLGNKNEVKRLRNDLENVYTLNQVRSPHISRTAAKYAILNEDFQMYELLHKTRENVKARSKGFELHKKDTGK